MVPDPQAYNRQLIAEFRAGNGDLNGRPLLLLTTTGAKSGKEHTTPLMYIPNGDTYIILASNMGAAKDPDWYRNILAHPQVTVEVQGTTFATQAVVAAGTEREQMWAQVIAIAPFFTEHQTKISRQIPVILLKRLVS